MEKVKAPKPEPPVEKAPKKPVAKSVEDVPLDPVAEKGRIDSLRSAETQNLVAVFELHAPAISFPEEFLRLLVQERGRKDRGPSFISDIDKLVEEADYRSTAELFSRTGGDDKTLDNFIPKSESDFLEYAELISQKMRPYEAVMRLSMTGLKAQDAKDIASSVTAIANEKIKDEKEAIASKKKSGSKKKKLHVEAVVNAYDGYDDYDFM
ncbi:hypothetical protein RND71_035269 [Anisodus tanguticus]|uniref:Eukaryotic translation initiation factor 3 30 kDa subunit n=1 Tax=Anisodus tanguticus TaxID=243964 RepID=A0AAE1R5A2_9SOLA|nr:hypothetical protein RND71_035269 [Anisodus tanguticus]